MDKERPGWKKIFRRTRRNPITKQIEYPPKGKRAWVFWVPDENYREKDDERDENLFDEG